MFNACRWPVLSPHGGFSKPLLSLRFATSNRPLSLHRDQIRNWDFSLMNPTRKASVKWWRHDQASVTHSWLCMITGTQGWGMLHTCLDVNLWCTCIDRLPPPPTPIPRSPTGSHTVRMFTLTNDLLRQWNGPSNRWTSHLDIAETSKAVVPNLFDQVDRTAALISVTDRWGRDRSEFDGGEVWLASHN